MWSRLPQDLSLLLSNRASSNTWVVHKDRNPQSCLIPMGGSQLLTVDVPKITPPEMYDVVTCQI